MASKASRNRSSIVEGLEANPLVDRIAKKFAEGAIELRGFVGTSPLPGKVRLYFSLRLDSWVEIPASAIAWHKKSDDDTEPTSVFVGSASKVEIGFATAATALQQAGPLESDLCSTVGRSDAIAAKRPLQPPWGDSVDVMCGYIRGRAWRLVGEYAGASESRRTEILAELSSLGGAWNAAGCRSRYGDVTKLTAAPGKLDLPTFLENI